MRRQAIDLIAIRERARRLRATLAWAFAVPIATVIAVTACAPTTWTLSLYNFGTSQVVARVTADGNTTDRVVDGNGSGVAYRGDQRPAAISLTFLDPETCAVIATYNEVPQANASVVINDYGGVGSEVDDEAAVGALLEVDTRC